MIREQVLVSLKLILCILLFVLLAPLYFPEGVMRNLGFPIFALGGLEAHDVDACSFDSGSLCFSFRSDEKSRSWNIRPMLIQGKLSH